MAMQTGGGTARDRIMARARALDDEEKKKQQAQQPQQTRQSAQAQVPMRYRQTAQEPGQEAAQQPQTTARDRIQARARAMGQQRVMSGLGDLTVEEYQYALKQAEAASPKRDENPGFFSRVGKWLVGKTEKTPEEIVAEQWDALEAARKREELASLDLDEYEKLLERAKKQAADARPDFNIHAMGAYDAAAENTPAQRKADEMQQTYNLAKQVQFERQGEQALAQLTPKQLEAVETLVQTPATGTSVMSAGVARENARDQAYSVLLEGGYSYKTISDLVTWRSRQQDKEAYQKTVQWHEDLADSGVLGGAAATVLSVPENLLSGVGAIDVALQKANQAGGEERPVNYYSAPMRLYGGANAARETVGQKLERNTDATIFGQNVASAAYGIGTSMLDSGATVALAAIGVPPVVGSSLLGGAAATGAMVDAKDRGVDDTHALWTGVFAGVAETLFEDVSLERLLKLDVPQGTLRQRMQTTLKNTLLQAGTEGSEELFTDFANYITDRAINGGLSEYDTAVRAYMDQGLSQKEASQKAGADLAAQMALDFVAGGVAGGLMAGGKAAIDNAGQDREMRQYSDLAPAAAEERLAADPGSRAARRVQKQVQQGKPVSGAALRETMAQNVEAQNQAVTEQVRKLAQQRLEELGDTQAEKTSRAVAQLYDQELPQYRRELARKALRSSEYGQRVANEMEDAVETGHVRTLLEQAGETEDATRVPRWTSGEWAENLPRYTSQGAYINQLMERRVNPSATDKRPVTGFRYNQETGQLDAIVKGEDGKAETIPKERAATTGRQEWLADLAADLKEAAPTMIASYMDGQDVQTFSRQWHNAYEYGAAGVKKDYAMNSQAVDQLNATQRELAYDAGAAARAVQQTQERMKFPQEGQDTGMTREGAVSLKGATVGGVTYAPVTQETMTRRQRDSVEVMRQLARVSGVDVVFYQSRANEKGEYTAANGFYRDGTVYLDINAGKNRVGDMSETAVLLTASHELTHFIQEYSPAQYEQLRDFVVERLMEAEDVDLDALVQRHQKNQPGLSYDQALDEVVADGCQMMLKDSQAAAQLAKKNRSLAGNIRSWLRKWVKRLQEAMRGLTARSREAKAMEQYAGELQKIWDNALVRAAENRQRAQSGQETGAAAQIRTEGQYEIRYPTYTDEQMEKNAAGLRTMKAVAKVTGDELGPRSISIKERVTKYFASLGNNVHTEAFGDVALSNSSVHSEIRHGHTSTKVATYAAIPEVLRSGVVIYRKEKNRHGLERIVVAAPVEVGINAEKMYVGVMLQRDPQTQRLYLHDAVTEKESAVQTDGHLSTTGPNGMESELYTTSILHRALQVKKNTESKPAGALPKTDTHATPIDSASTNSIHSSAGNSQEKFSMREPAEETRDLIAIHNMTLDNLRGALRLGGLPMPSIAIVKAAAGHSKYGPISVVFEKSSIDPQTDRRNKVYGGDAYTPTAPQVDYPVHYEAMRNVEKHIAELSGKVAGGIFRNDIALRRLGVEDESDMNAEQLAERLSQDDSVRAAYLADVGKALEPVRQAKEFSRYGNEALESLVRKIGVTELARINAEMETGNCTVVKDAEVYVREIIRNAYEEKHRRFLERKPELKQKRIDQYMENNVSTTTVEDFVRDAWEFYQDNGATTDEIDHWATSDKLHEEAKREDVKDWLLPQLDGVLGEAGIYNGKERYTPEGDERSFVQTHYAYTLENIVRAMAETQKERGGQTWGVSAKAMQAVSTPDYRSIAEIKSDSGRLGAVEGEAYESAVQRVEKLIEQATRKVMRENKPHSDNQFDESQIIGEVMMEAAQGSKTEAAIRRAFQKEGYTISRETASAVQMVFREAAQLPTEYFEAKPQRAVHFNEAAVVVVPDDLPTDVRNRLEELGARVRQYKAGDESSRLEAVNADDALKFSVREAGITDREVLANALESATRNDEERRILKWYREVAKSLTEHEQLLEDMRQRLADHKSGEKVLPKGKAKDLEDYTEYIVNKLDEEDRKLLKIESMGPMRKLLEREREYVERRLAGAQEEKNRYQAEFEQRLQEARRHEQESLLQYRQRREESERRRGLKAQIQRSAKQLADRLNTNTDKKHIPEPLKRPVAQLLAALDLSSQRALRGGELTNWDLEYLRAMKGIRDVLAEQESYQNGLENSEDVLGGYLDLPPGMIDLLDEHMKKVENIIEKHMPGEHILQRMDTTELMRTQTILAVVSRSVTKMNQLLENRTYAQVADAAEDTITALHQRGQYQGTAEKAEQFVSWDNTLPWYAFQRFGKGGAAIFEELMDGQDKLGFNMKKVLDFRKALIDDETARAWDTETHQVDLLDDEGKAVKATLTTAQLMGLYCLSRRKQAMGHLMGGGIRIANIEGQGKLRRKTIRQDDHFKMNTELLGQVLSLLTDQQIAAADKMQRFMTDQGGEWGNEVTMKRFGYRGFTEEIYYPIETDRQDRITQAKDGTEGSLYRLQNISAVKPVVRDANNALVVRGIFDVFTNHMADMAKYNAMVIPIVDAQKWYNYKSDTKNEQDQVITRTVQRAMTKAYGQSANRYVVQLLKDLNGVKESGARGEQFAVKMISNYKRAAVAANLRVAVLQPTAYVRAAAVLDYKYLAAAFGNGGRATDTVKIPEGAVSKSVIERAWYALLEKTGTLQAMNEMLGNSGIALWKDMGFFDTDVGRSVRDQIKGKGSKLEKLVDKTMTAAEWGDKLTWARLWRACKLEVQEKQKLSGQALLEGTARRFREVVYQTQVVDSTMTRSDIMRSSSTFSKIATSFMSEPTVSYNLVMEGVQRITEDAKRMGLKTAIGRNWKITGRAFQAYVVSALASAVVESLADALRDTDDDPLWEKLLDAFGGWGGNLVSDLNPLNKLPYLREVFNAIDGRDNGRMDTEVWAAFKKTYDILMETYRLATGKQEKATATTYYGNMTTYGKVYQTFRAVSMLSGLPISATSRELVTAWNNIVGRVWPGLKCRTYESKKLREAYKEYVKPAGIDYEVLTRAMEYVSALESDKDEEGKAVSGSLKAKYVAYIQSLGLTPAQEKAMWLALKNSTWSDKSTPWA